MSLLSRKDVNLIPICPEQLGGLPTPRMPSEITAKGQVMTKDGVDVTTQYQRGAGEALKLAKLLNCSYAVLKERSPSCGNMEIYDGTFSGRKVKGDGITADLLKKHGIAVYGESKLHQLIELLDSLSVKA